MQHPGEWPLFRLVPQDRDHLVIRGPAMHDQGQPGLPRGGDMTAEQIRLQRARTVIVMKI